MKANKTLPFLTILLLLTALSYPSKSMGQKTWEVSLGTSFPLGDFQGGDFNRYTGGSNYALFDKGDKGGSDYGFNVSGGLSIPTKLNNLSVCLRGDIHLTLLDSKVNDYLDLNADYLGATYGGTFETKRTPSYINIPIMAGLRYAIPLRENLALFFEAEAGLNFRFITKYKVQSDDIMLELRYESANTLALRFGVGLKVARFLSVQMAYYDLGKSAVQATTEATNNSASAGQYTKVDVYEGDELHISLITIGATFHF